jgi:hypothetical protein
VDALDLFTDPATIARTSDPATSKAGARDVALRAGSQKARLLIAYQLAGVHGLTDEQAGERASMTSVGYWKRCSELRAAGYIEPTGEDRVGSSGSAQAVHRLTARGARAIAEAL